MQSSPVLPVIGMDIAKSVFQLHVVDPATGVVERHKLRRDRGPTFFANCQRSLVALEACGGAHHWARTLQALGHEARSRSLRIQVAKAGN
ncbi:MAG: transposase [Curvibacter sp.]|nr:transposase [Curvibacter sp.]